MRIADNTKKLFLLLQQLPLLGALLLWREQVSSHPLATALGVVLYESAMFILSFGKKVWLELEEDAIQSVADYTFRVVAGTAPGFLRRYRRLIVHEFGVFNVRGLGLINTYTLALNQVYVEPRISSTGESQRVNTNIIAEGGNSGNRIWDFLRSGKREDATAMVILGPPGSGKTTLLQNLAITLASNSQQRQRMRSFIPILLYLRNHVSAIDRSSPPSLGELVQDYFSNPGLFPALRPPADWFEMRLERGRCLVLLDGLDEIVGGAERAAVAAWIDKQIITYPRCRFVITSRPQGYAASPLLRANVYEMQPLSAAQVRTFIENWYLANEIVASGNTANAAVRQRASRDAADLIQRLATYEALRAFTVNPLLLTMIAMIHRYHGSLPGSNVELYAEICEVLLGRWRQARGVRDPLSVTQKLIVLRELAAHMMERKLQAISMEEALRVIALPLERVGVASHGAPDFLVSLQSGSGLLLEREAGRWSFAHRVFQEYLTAAHWLESRRSEQNWGELVSDGWWHETLKLYAAQGDATPIIRACLEVNTVTTLILATEVSDYARKLSPDIRKAADDRTVGDLDSTDLRRFRHAIEVLLSRRLRTLSRIDESREIDLTHLTCGEYQLFLDEMRGHGKLFIPEHWASGRFEAGRARYPLSGVRFQGAVAFCEWLAERQGGYWRYRLPSSEEARLYPAHDQSMPEWIQDKDTFTLSKSGDTYKLKHKLERADNFTNILPHLPLEDIEEHDFDVERTRNLIRYLVLEDNAVELAQAMVHALSLDGAVEREIVEALKRYFAQALAGILNLLFVSELTSKTAVGGLSQESVQGSVRMLAFSLSRDRALGLDLKLNIDHELGLAQDRELALARAPARTLARALARAIMRTLVLAIPNERVLDKELWKKLSAIIDPIDRAIEQNDISRAQLLARSLKNDPTAAVSRLAALIDDLLTAAAAPTITKARQAQYKYIARILSYTYPDDKANNHNANFFYARWFNRRKTVSSLKRRQQAVLEIYQWLQLYSGSENTTPPWGAIRLVREKRMDFAQDG